MGNCLGKKRVREDFTEPQLEPINRSDNSAKTNGISPNNGTMYECSIVDENVSLPPPQFSAEQKQLVVESWHYVENHVTEVGVSAFMDLFKESPEATNAFVFLKHYSTENEEFYDLLSKHALRVLGIVTLLVKELKSNDSETADDRIHDIVFPLGRKHVGYKSNTIHMEILGVLIVESLMRTVPKNEMEPEKYDNINKAFLLFFKVIVYWLQFGFKYEKRSMT